MLGSRSNKGSGAKGVALIAAAAGAVGGIINGYLGTGGGIVMMFAYMYLAPRCGMEEKDCFAATVLSILPMSVVSAIIYNQSENVAVSGIGRFVIPALIGGLIGAFLTDRMKTKILKYIFAAVMIWSGIYMFFGRR